MTLQTRKLPLFVKSQQAFNNAIKEVKAEGKTDIDSYPEITEEGKYLSYFSP